MFIFREPLLGFVLIGAVFYALFFLVTEEDRPRIEVSSGQIERQITDRELVLERPLSEQEKLSLREGFLDQEALVREAMARGLYLNDGKIRHRLADKMFYLLTEDIPAPSDADLQTFYSTNAERYRTQERISFDHRFFANDRARASAAIGADTAEPLEEGVGFYMGNELEAYSADELIPVFGLAFTRMLGDQPEGVWVGPMQSSRGWHLLRVTERQPPRQRRLDEVEVQLGNDWQQYQLMQQRRTKLDTLLKRYEVVDVP